MWWLGPVLYLVGAVLTGRYAYADFLMDEKFKKGLFPARREAAALKEAFHLSLVWPIAWLVEWGSWFLTGRYRAIVKKREAEEVALEKQQQAKAKALQFWAEQINLASSPAEREMAEMGLRLTKGQL